MLSAPTEDRTKATSQYIPLEFNYSEFTAPVFIVEVYYVFKDLDGSSLTQAAAF